MRIKLSMVALEARRGGGGILAALLIQFVYADTKTFTFGWRISSVNSYPNKIMKMIFYICILKLNTYNL